MFMENFQCQNKRDKISKLRISPRSIPISRISMVPQTGPDDDHRAPHVTG